MGATAIGTASYILLLSEKSPPETRRKATLQSLSRSLSEKAPRGRILLSDKTPLPQEGEQFQKRKTGPIRPGPQPGRNARALFIKAGGSSASANCTNFPVSFYYTCFIAIRQVFLFGSPCPQKTGLSLSENSIVQKREKLSFSEKIFFPRSPALQSHTVPVYNLNA
jgi:hypothetical protein